MPLPALSNRSFRGPKLVGALLLALAPMAGLAATGSGGSAGGAGRPAQESAREGGGGASDLLGVTRFPPTIQEKSAEGNRNFTLLCTDNEGNQLRQGEAGYEACMQSVRGKAQPKTATAPRKLQP